MTRYPSAMKSKETLYHLLWELDRRSYKAYKDIQGNYNFPDFTLIIDYVQGDPFASPSKVRVLVPQTIAQFPKDLYQTKSREIALRDYITRKFDEAAYRLSVRRGTGTSGLIVIANYGQEVLERTSVFINDEVVEVRFFVGLPASGRSILGRQAAEMLCDDIPEIVRKSVKFSALNSQECYRQVETVEDADFLRKNLAEKGLVAFIGDDSNLPRRSGVDERPLLDNVILFQSPPSLSVEFNCPNRGLIRGMGIAKGVTLIVGGGYHGKSTLLHAIALGVYNHIPGDGREFVVTNPDAVKIRAEDGRSIAGVDISPFINELPQGRSTTEFTTENASGSTSQAANIMEVLEVGLVTELPTNDPPQPPLVRGEKCPVLLVDEDTAASNFMIRDRRMQELISKDKEPITPFIDKVRQLYLDYGVSTILVMGGSGDYFDVADTVISMENFQAFNVTEKAKEIANNYISNRTIEGGEAFGKITPRIPIPSSLDPSRGRQDVRLKVRDMDEVTFGTEEIDVTAVEQIVDKAQLRAIVSAMVYGKQKYMDGKKTLREIIDQVMADIENQGMDILSPFREGDFAMFRRLELAAAINRLRTLSVISSNNRSS